MKLMYETINLLRAIVADLDGRFVPTHPMTRRLIVDPYRKLTT